MKALNDMVLALLAVSAFLWLNVGMAALVGHLAK
jgi:hypothetical protein